MAIVNDDTVQFKIGKLPNDIVNRLKYLYRLQEKLRLYHNLWGKKCDDGIIALKEFRLFQLSWFEPRNMLLSNEMCKCKSELQKDETVVCSIDDIEEK